MHIIHLLATRIRNLYLRHYFDKHNKIGKDVHFSRDTVIGKNCVIGNDVTFGEKVSLGDNVVIGKGATLERIVVGNGCVIEGKVIITGHGDGMITLGNETFIGHLTVLDWSADITIGDYVHIGYSYFWTHSSAKMALNGHSLSDKDDKYRPRSPITIGNFVYIGVHSTIYPGVNIGDHSLIAPNSVVAHDVEPYTMVGGTPAKYIKSTKDMIIDNG